MRRSGGQLALVSAAGAVLLIWPLLAGSSAPLAVVSGAVVALVLVTVAVETATRRLDARQLALLATIAAIDSALRLLFVEGIGGWSPIFFLILAAGYVYGPSFGFVCGTTALLVSAVVTGGIGPWLPYEALGCGWIGVAAGLAGMRRSGAVRTRDLVVLAVVGAVTGLLYGALTDLQDWITFYRGTPAFGWQPGLSSAELARHFAVFYVTTSLVWDLFRSVGNALAVLLLGLPVLAALVRYRQRFSVIVLPG
ncbi:MAG: ECF transporter S component [Candidatus Dormibacteraeota bacterium]|nr:ECF transporter S component [Candidatus Dormibacteraeota bacterium]